MDPHPEFPGMPEPRPARKGSLRWYGEEAERYIALSAEHRGLTLPAVAGLILGVSKQRVDQLMQQGRLTVFEVAGRKWLAVDEVEAFSTLERTAAFRYAPSPASLA